MKKITKILLAILLIATTLLSFTTNVNAAAPSSLQLGGAKSIEGYVAGTYFTTKTTTDGKLVYCLNINKSTAKNITANLTGEMDAGIAYIMENGYPNKTFTGNADYDYYITQTSLWWYLDNRHGGSNLSHSFKTNGSDPHGLRPHIVALTEAAHAAGDAGYATPSLSLSTNNSTMKLSSDGEYYVSNPITANAAHTGNYKTKVTSGPEGAETTDLNGTAKTEFAPTEQFLIRIPAESITDNKATVKVTATATGTVNKAYSYQPTDSGMQGITPSWLYPETTDLSASIETGLSVTKIIVNKTDASTNQALAGATITIKNSAGEEVVSYTSTDESYELKNIAYGTYTIEETTAPAGYEKSTKIYTVTISEDNLEQTITIENHPIVIVPDTASNQTIIITIIGLLGLALGFGFVRKYAKN